MVHKNKKNRNKTISAALMLLLHPEYTSKYEADTKANMKPILYDMKLI